jgi:3-oxoacyl-[acyl-carrier protein] reductase
MRYNMAKKLADKVAIVTGASKGIGASIARHLAAEGAAVVVNYSASKKEADQVVAEIVNKGGRAIALQGNVSVPADIQRLISETVKAFEKIDILVNNAGIYEFSSLENITPEHFHKMFNINVLGLLLVTQEAVKHFPPTGGCVINISSVAATLALPNTSVYSATKASVDTITKSLAKELASRKIRVNAVNPGIIETEGTHAVGIFTEDIWKKRVHEIPLGRIGQPQDIARMVVFLASDDASWITDETFFVTGGVH